MRGLERRQQWVYFTVSSLFATVLANVSGPRFRPNWPRKRASVPWLGAMHTAE
jgi:hypothetical protein